jgi:hypothetical protein
MKMEYAAMIRRGWPNEGALDRAEVIKAGSTLVNGDWVVKETDGTVKLAGATAASNASVGLVVSGNGDAASAANSNKAVVLWSGFIADVSNYDTGASYAPGSPLMVVSGKVTLQTSTNPIIGYVLDVVTVSATETAHLTILVK